MAYDDRSGLFADATGVVLRRPGGELGVLGGFASIGYARRIGDDISVDVGLLRAQFARHSSFNRDTGYTELFAGVTTRSISAHAALSPDYLWDGTTTLYLSGELVQRPADKWRIVGHAGLLATLRGGPPYPAPRTQYDWSVRVGRQLGHADVELMYSNGGPNRQLFDGVSRTKSALTGTVRWAF